MKIPAWLQTLFHFGVIDAQAWKRRKRAAKTARWYKRDGRTRETRAPAASLPASVRFWRLDRIAAKRAKVREAKAQARLLRRKLRKGTVSLWAVIRLRFGHRGVSAACARWPLPWPSGKGNQLADFAMNRQYRNYLLSHGAPPPPGVIPA